MKRLLSVLCILLMLTGLCSCAAADDASSETEPASETTSEISDETSETNETSGTDESKTGTLSTGTSAGFGENLITWLWEHEYSDASFGTSPAGWQISLAAAASAAVNDNQTALLSMLGFSTTDEMQSWYETLEPLNFTSAILKNSASREDYNADFTEAASAFGCTVGSYAASDDLQEYSNFTFDGSDPEEFYSILLSGFDLNVSVSGSKDAVTDIFTDTDGNETTVTYLVQTIDAWYYENNNSIMILIPLDNGQTLILHKGQRSYMFDQIANLKENGTYETMDVAIPILSSGNGVTSFYMMSYLIEQGCSDAENWMAEDAWLDDSYWIYRMDQAGTFSITASDETEDSSYTLSDTDIAFNTSFEYVLYSGYETENQTMLYYGQVYSTSVFE